MSDVSEPAVHRERERLVMRHLRQLLEDERFVVDTARGRRAVTSHIVEPKLSDHAVEVKRLMIDAGVYDRDLEARMPAGELLEATLYRPKWFGFGKKAVARIVVRCESPVKELVAGETPSPLASRHVRRLMDRIDSKLTQKPIPTTFVLCSTSGFTGDCESLTERNASRVVFLVEPNESGGWVVHTPEALKDLKELLDPEAAEQKRRRIHEAIEERRIKMIGGGVSADELVESLELPKPAVEAELKAYARRTPGVKIKTLDGRQVLFREGTMPTLAETGNEMPLVDRFKSLFSRKGDDQKKIAVLSEKRAALSQQRDRIAEDLSAMESREVELKEQFGTHSSESIKRRIASELTHLRKEMGRRQQLAAVLNQQVNVVSTHLHQLELSRQGSAARLPSADEIAADAAKAEEILADLQASSEIADEVGGVEVTGLSGDEQAVYEELERENRAASEDEKLPDVESISSRESDGGEAADTTEPESEPPSPATRRQEPEAG